MATHRDPSIDALDDMAARRPEFRLLWDTADIFDMVADYGVDPADVDHLARLIAEFVAGADGMLDAVFEQIEDGNTVQRALGLILAGLLDNVYIRLRADHC